MSREKTSPSAGRRSFFLGIQPNRLNVHSESGLPQVLRLREPSLDAICSIRSIDSPDERREFADLYAAFVKDSGCEVKISNARSDAMMLSCRQSTPQQLATVYSDSVLAPALTNRGFKTFIFSSANDVFTPAAISDNGLVKLPSITAAQLVQEYGIKSAEEIAKEEEEEQNYRSFLEGFVDKMLGFSNAGTPRNMPARGGPKRIGDNTTKL
jgi:hypothetical protein